MIKDFKTRELSERRGGRWLVAGAMLTLTLAACNTDKLLDAGVPDRVDASTLGTPGTAALLVNSAVGDFECAIGSAVTVEGIISDELADAQLGAAGWPYDRRDANTQPNGIYGTGTCTSSQNPGLYLPLSTARWSADNILTKLTGWTDAQVPSRQLLIARAALYAGLSYTAMGMSMCEAAFDLQPQINQQAMFAAAEARFSTAITAATAAGGLSGDSLKAAAYLGRARARLFQGNKANALTDAQQVPSGFVLYATAGSDDNRRYNRVFSSTGQFGDYTVDTLARNLQTQGVADPRSAVTAYPDTRPADGLTAIWAPAKYSSDASPIRIATWDEAQLIIAEAQGGAAAVATINALRTAYNAAHPSGTQIPLYAGATDPASIQTLIINERQRALFVEGFRNYDMQRFNIAFTGAEATGQPYPLKGGNYGNTTCLPLPDIERFNNPNIHP
ncbi:MAG: hypothetical protein ACJ796_19505 [Gemmatimonadaceae bacterium]